MNEKNLDESVYHRNVDDGKKLTSLKIRLIITTIKVIEHQE